MSSEIVQAIKHVCAEKGISYDSVLESIEAALAAAYRKDFGTKGQNIQVNFNPETGESEVFEVQTIIPDLSDKAKAYLEERVEYREREEEHPLDLSEDEADLEIKEEARAYNPKQHIQITEAKSMDPKYEIGDEIKTKLEIPEEYGRMAAQTAKQVIIQKLREAERQTVFDEFKDREGEVLNATVQRKEGRMVFIDIGKATALLPPDEQVRGERYVAGQRIKVFVKSVNMSQRGPEIIVSRGAPEIVSQLFELEIPEIANGSVEIKGISREAGSRTKISVEAIQENIDPIGSCVGQRGSRIQTIIQEIGGEKIDIIEYDEDILKYIANALLPAKILNIDLDQETNEANITVEDDQLSLAIGKDGQNVRLASKLTGWKLNIVNETGEEPVKESEEENASEEVVEETSEESITPEVKEDIETEQTQEDQDVQTEEASSEEVEK